MTTHVDTDTDADALQAKEAGRRPSFQFYPGDWSSNPNLKRCTFAEKGIWLEVLCLMHDQAEYGVLRWPLKEIAEAVKCRVSDLQALTRKGVLKGDDLTLTEPFIYVPRSGRKNGAPVTLLDAQPGPVWYSSRMVRDEYRNDQRGKGTRFGDAPSGANGDVKSDGAVSAKPSPSRAPKRSPTRRQGAGPSSSSSPSGNSPEPIGSAPASAGAGIPATGSGTRLTAREKVFALGVALLGEGATSRSLLGKLSKAHGEDVLADVLAELTLDPPAEPRAFLIASCEQRGKRAEVGADDDRDILADPTPRWALEAGFPDRFMAENAGCLRGNAHLFRDGVRMQ